MRTSNDTVQPRCRIAISCLSPAFHSARCCVRRYVAAKLLELFAQLPPCVVGMEACSERNTGRGLGRGEMAA